MALHPPPERIWWKPLGREEKLWVTVAAVWCFYMFFMLIGWYFLGAQQMPGNAVRVSPAEFKTRVEAWIEANKVGEENGVPIVRPQAGADVYLIGKQWQWTPILELEAGKTYTLHVSSIDVQHGLSIQPININMQVLPGYEFRIQLTPNQAGDYSLWCNEFCSIGHHLMTGKIVVK